MFCPPYAWRLKPVETGVQKETTAACSLGSLGGTHLHARSPAPAVTCGAPPLAAGHRLGLECNAWRLKPLETGMRRVFKVTLAVKKHGVASPYQPSANDAIR